MEFFSDWIKIILRPAIEYVTNNAIVKKDNTSYKWTYQVGSGHHLSSHWPLIVHIASSDSGLQHAYIFTRGEEKIEQQQA